MDENVPNPQQVKHSPHLEPTKSKVRTKIKLKFVVPFVLEAYLEREWEELQAKKKK